ncbi:MAG: hypothetical protein JNN30_21440 [Rhodanobacteraceae bacterium]|nr:hypothetical protein [Rhodanobacteraceae bacterium]
MNRAARGLVFVLAFAGLAGTASAQQLSRSGQPPGVPVQIPWPAPLAAQTITQSSSAAINTGASVSCNGGAPGFIHTDNSYYRAFTLSTFGNLTLPQFRVDTVSFGVETANDGGGVGQPVTVNLWRSSANPPTVSTLTAVSSDAVTVPDSAMGTVFTANIATQPVFTVATDILVVEIFTPAGTAGSRSFFIGSNSGGQSAPSFIRAASCGINEITDLAGVHRKPAAPFS